MKAFAISALFLLFVRLAPAIGADAPIRNLRTLAETVEQADSAGKTFAIDEAIVANSPSRLSDTFGVSDDTGNLSVTDGMFYPEHILQAGDRLKMSGVIIKQHNRLYNYAKATNIVILSHGAAPAPVDTSLSEINAGRVLDRLVRTEGRLVDVFQDEIDSRFVFLVIADGADFIYASLHDDAAATEYGKAFKLLDAVVRATGFCSRMRPQGIGRVIDITLSLQSADALTTLAPPPTDPFSAPPLNGRIREVQRLPGVGTFRRKVRGSVIAVWGGNTALVRTDGNTLSTIGFATEDLPAYGTFIETVGVPETDLYTLNLSRAIWRPADATTSSPPPPDAIPVSQLFTDKLGNDAFRQAYHGRALKFTGRVRALPTIGNERLILEVDGHTLPIDFSATPAALAGIEIGCTLEVTGTCVMETENWRPQLPFPQIRGIFLVVRTPQDVHILSHPSRWTPARLLIIIALLAVGFIALLLRNILQSRLARARLDERTRLAVELHDTIAQNLTGASFEINAAERLVTSDGNASLRHLGRAAQTLKSCRDELRNCIWDLRNRSLEDPDMATAIRMTLEPHIGNAALSVRFNIPRAIFSDNTAHAILRIIRELAVNAVRHGDARSVRVAGELEGERLRFSVRDDGIGFDPENHPGVREGHFGLQGIRERIKKFNGEMILESHPGSGTRVELSMNLASNTRRRQAK